METELPSLESLPNLPDAPIINQNSNIEDSEEDLTPITRPIVTPEHVEEWKKWFLTQKFSLDTVDMYYSFIKRYVGYKVLVNSKTLDRFRETHMGTVCAAALKNFFKFLVYKKKFPETLLTLRFEKSKQERKDPKIITPDEVEKIINGMEFARDKILTKLLYSLALRVEEGVNLQWIDFNFSEWLQDKTQYGKVTLRHTKRGKFRVLPVNPTLMATLYDNCDNKDLNGVPVNKHIAGDDDLWKLITSDKRKSENLTDDQVKQRNRKYYLNLSKQRYRNLLYSVSQKVLDRKISPHVFRHAKAQYLMDNGTPIETIQAFLGHSSISTTQIYAKASITKIKKDLEQHDAPEKYYNKHEEKKNEQH